MSLKIGIIGLPNVGKSTLFNALVGEQLAQVANFPFCTIEPNIAIVPVPDKRLFKLAETVGVDTVIPATIEFVDVAGLIEGASHGEGLGNQFLGNIRTVDALLHVVRCFENPNVVHIRDLPDPVADIEIIHTELALADFQQIAKMIEKLVRQIKGDIKLKPQLDMAEAIKEFVGQGKPLWLYPDKDSPTFRELNQSAQFLTAKRMIYIANVDEESLPDGNKYSAAVDAYARNLGAQSITICAELEHGMATLSREEQQEYLALSGITDTSLDKVITASYQLLDLISFFTFNQNEARAWTIKQGWTAPKAAGQIHTDFETGFIRAEVASFEEFIQHGSWAALKAVGHSRSEGRNYRVQDGEVVLFRVNP